jgi:hypothetical protein
MRWEDERYVRVYTRDTTDWVALGWQAQGLFLLVMRKVDRAGILDLGKSGVRGLAALVAMPLEVVERALPILLEDGCVKLNGSVLVIPNFIEAQEAKQSDAQRKREQRARDRDMASAGVTNRDQVSRNVTGADASGGVASVSVTPSCAVPSRTEETLPPARSREPDPTPEPGAPAAEPAPATPAASRPEAFASLEAVAAEYPATAVALARLEAHGYEAAISKQRVTRAAVEKAIGAVGVEVACERIVAAWDPALPWLGWYLEVIAGKGKGAPPPAPAEIPLPNGPPAFVALLQRAAEVVTSDAFRRDLAAATPEEHDGVLWLLPADPYHEARLKDPAMFGKRIPELAAQVGVTVRIGGSPESAPRKAAAL